MDITDLQNLMDRLARQPDDAVENLSVDETEQLHAALQDHPEWSDQMRHRERFDLLLTETLQDVSPSEAGRERLHDLLRAESSASSPAPSTETLKRSRRRAIGLVTAASLLFAVSVGLLISNLSPRMSLAEVERQMPILWSQSTERMTADSEPSETSANSPGDEWEIGSIEYEDEWRSATLESGEVVALRKFVFESKRRRLHRGLLVAVPAANIDTQQIPTADSPFTADIHYRSTSDGLTLAIVSWKSQRSNRVHFLAVPAETRTLDALEELLYANPV